MFSAGRRTMGSLGSRFQAAPHRLSETPQPHCAGSAHTCECKKRKRSSRYECDSEPDEEDSLLDTPCRSHTHSLSHTRTHTGKLSTVYLHHYVNEIIKSHINISVQLCAKVCTPLTLLMHIVSQIFPGKNQTIKCKLFACPQHVETFSV